MNTQIIQMVISWEKSLEIQQEESKKRRYFFGVKESSEGTAFSLSKNKRQQIFNWHRPEPVCECRPKPACECV